MIVIVCVDDKNGMMFNNRRQSQDSAVRKDIIESVKTHLFMNSYSAKLFKDNLTNIIINENFLDSTKQGDVCFVENFNINMYEQNIEQIIIYHWNRVYPVDFYLDIDIKSSEWELIDQKEIVGTSHDNILKEIYLHKN